MFTPPNTPQPQPAPSLPATPGPGAPAPTITPSGVTTIPPQVIESDGTVNIPFSGRLNVIGKTPGAVAKEVEKQLEGKAARPQVIVTLVGNATNTATVGGEVNSPRLVALSLRGERLLDVIAASGGAKYPAYETFVNVVRDGRAGSVLLQTLITNPKENVTVGPNDQIFLTRSPRTFAVLGAAQKVSQYTFDTERVTLAEAVARAGGPIDTIGDPSGVYLFRYEPIGVLQEIGGPRMLNGVDIVDRRFVPVLYRIAFNESDGYFLSQAIELRDKDVVLITNSEVTQMQKVLAVVRGVTGVAYDLSRGGN
jgi:polysaccharide export outer membrane protein